MKCVLVFYFVGCGSHLQKSEVADFERPAAGYNTIRRLQVAVEHNLTAM